MNTSTLLLMLLALGNAQDTKKGTQDYHDRCPPNICKCENVQDHSNPQVFYMIATCTEVPTQLDERFRKLKVTGEVDVITKQMIETIGAHIHNMDFSNCKIRRIEKGAFGSSLKNLKSLKLSNNKLTELDEDIFHCSNLEELYLDGNDIRKIHDDTFKKLAKLKNLYLQHNMIQKCSFNFNSTLFELNLYDNEIQTFELDLNKVQLNRLDLCGNRLQQFPLKISTKNNNLTHLCLSDRASHLPRQFAAIFPALLNLTLEGSTSKTYELDGTTMNEIKNLGSIQTLILEYFHIQNLEFIAKKNNLNLLILKNITLGNKAGVGNVIKTLSFLTELWLDKSPDLVKPVLGDGSVVSQLTRLEYLSIQHTELISIAKHNIPQSVLVLNIANNPLRCDCKLSWIVNKHKTTRGMYLKDTAHTTCSTPAKYDEQELLSVINQATCSESSDGMLEQNIVNSESTPEKYDMDMSDHKILYIVLGCCLGVLILIGIILAIVLSIMKKRRMHQITPEGGDTQMEQQQQQIKQSSSRDTLLKK